MKRSNSSSQIPMRRTSGSRRSQSLSRNSIREPSLTRNAGKITPSHIGQRIGISGSSSGLQRNSREPSLGRNSTKVTPLNKVRLHLPSSASSSKARISPGSAFRETKTIQSLASSKKWVAEQFAKVQNFVENSGYFDSNVVTPKNIKPPSMKAFIYTSKVLLEQIFGDLNMEQANYKEVITDKLKVLQYPGTLTKSVLKTVNTMHSWPQVIGMWAWLIDKLVRATQNNERSLTHMDPCEKDLYLKTEVCREFIMARYFLFNSNNDQDEIDQVNQQYIGKFFEACGVDPEEYSNLEDDVKKLQKHEQTKQEELKEWRNQYNEKLDKLEQMKQEIEDFETIDATRHNKLKEQLNKLKEEKNALIAKREVIQAKNANLREAIKVQPCTYGRKKELLRNVNELKRHIETKRARLDYLQKIRNDCNEKIDEEISKIYAAVKEWNNQIIPLSIEEPRLKELLFPETAFQREEFFEEIKKILLRKIEIDREISHELDRTEREISNLQEKMAMEESEMKIAERKISQLQEKNKDLHTKINALKIEKKQQLQKCEEEIKALSLEHNELLHDKSNEITTLEKHLLALQGKLDVDKKELSKLGEKSIAIYIEIYKEVRDSYEHINGILSSALDKLKKQNILAIEEQRNILSAFESIKKLKEEIEKCN